MSDKIPIDVQLKDLETVIDFRRSYVAGCIARGQTDPGEGRVVIEHLEAILESMRWLRDQQAVLKDPEVRTAMARARREVDADQAAALA